jgi:hypothetical protein
MLDFRLVQLRKTYSKKWLPGASMSSPPPREQAKPA